uniref:AraC-like transcriptional regulator n=1 Tax=Streptoalloteichus sp. ATCC 53650 TaxID=756733 RepID=K4P0X2_9PSEU|nr:AraC-like transcriptional regulator [Streptoalloteichus sp. ATCC 53650]
MEGDVEHAVRKVVETMRERPGEQFTIDDMARTAMFSKFHFTRMFQRVTGVSPSRFLAAVRLQEAKRLLVSTSLSVTEISLRVGYNSVGTFSYRFRTSVGLSPSLYRELGECTQQMCLDSKPLLSPSAAPATTLRGRIGRPREGDVGLVFVGLFPGRLPHGRPVRCTVLPGPGSYVLNDVVPGTWYLLTHSVSADRSEMLRLHDHDPGLFIGSIGPITIRPGTSTRLPEITLRPADALDPPVLLSLVSLRTNALGRRRD